MEEMEFFKETQPIKIWRPVPKNHTKLFVVLMSAAVVIVLGILFLWGYWVAIAEGLLMALLMIFIHYKLQKKIIVENGYFYLDRNELYLISLHKKDERLRAYLQDRSGDKQSEPYTLPNAFLMDMAEHSVIFHITEVRYLIINRDDNKYTANINYELVPYSYKGNIKFSLNGGSHEDFDSLMEIFKEKATSTLK